MAASVSSPSITTVQFLPRAAYQPVLTIEKDPLRHHDHDLHPWRPNAAVRSQESDSLYAQANNQYLYHLWYSGNLAPFMATRVLSIAPFKNDLLNTIQRVLNILLDGRVWEAKPGEAFAIEQWSEEIDMRREAQDKVVAVSDLADESPD
ncbi:uncharacterized protein C8A04DRAFT_29501 [Dichotomopilus funicola]|uniref:Uncharacterized protein n=1 Tax=Dichotomopilus funicola TaxID=1934379 RepID=A0AAN6V124_9PEZI|nr:hypothetical protein C8A04DRAFT_29501 [Dichotomopilus funicola]